MRAPKTRRAAALVILLISAPGPIACAPNHRPGGRGVRSGAGTSPLTPTRLVLGIFPKSPLFLGRLLTAHGEEAQLLFHLTIQNPDSTPQTLSRVILRTYRHRKLLTTRTFHQAALALSLRGLPWITIHDRRTLAAAHRWRDRFQMPAKSLQIAAHDGVSLLSLGGRFAPKLAPDAIVIDATSREGGHGELRIAVKTYVQQTRLRLPFRGPWVVLAGHRQGEPHASLHLASQRFAYDLVQTRAGGETFRGDQRLPTSYLAYDQPVLAAADGIVVQINDSVPDNTPVGWRPSWHVFLQRPADLAGNFVVLRHRGNEHTAYFHLKKGLHLHVGQHVKAGDVLGLCGNSGNSVEPHLHFQLQRGPDPLHARGLPARFSNFTWRYGHLARYIGDEEKKSSPLPERLVIAPGRPQGVLSAPTSRGLPATPSRNAKKR